MDNDDNDDARSHASSSNGSDTTDTSVYSMEFDRQDDHFAEAEVAAAALPSPQPQTKANKKNSSKPVEEASSSSTPASTTTYHMPATANTPVTSHFDALLECLDLLRLMEADENVTKQDVTDSIRAMLNNMLSTVMMHSFATSMSVKGWRVE